MQKNVRILVNISNFISQMDLSKKIPTYLIEKGNIVRLILLTAAFALVFINIYSPFGVHSWFSISKWELLLFSSLVILTGVLVVVISRVIMYHYCKRVRKINFLNYGIWILVEIMSMSLFYTLYEVLILKDARPFSDAFSISLQNTALVLLLPYSTIWLYFSWQDKKKQLDALSEGMGTPKSKQAMIPFKDERGRMRLTVKKDDFLYCQGADNYVTIYYHDQNKLSKFLLRNTLKNLENTFTQHSIIRCHRSFMINFEKVKLIEKAKDGLKLRLDTNTLLEVPVSKTYMDEVFKHFGQLN
jgi:hypothetical protein